MIFEATSTGQTRPTRTADGAFLGQPLKELPAALALTPETAPAAGEQQTPKGGGAAWNLDLVPAKEVFFLC